MFNRATLLFVIRHFLLSHLLIFLAAYMAFAVLLPVRNEAVVLFDVKIARTALARVMYFGDSRWYESVAVRGYDRPEMVKENAQNNWAFFPLYPVLVTLIDNRFVLGSLLWLAMLGAGVLLHAVVEERYGLDVARWTTLFFLYWPWSYTLTAFRPEGLLCALWLLSYYTFRKERYGWSSAAAFLSALAKPNGFLIAILLGMEMWKKCRQEVGQKSNSRLGPIVAVASGPVALVLFSGYMWVVTGNPLSWAKIQHEWGAAFLIQPIMQIVQLVSEPMLIGRWGWDAMAFNWLVFGSALLLARKLWAYSPAMAVFLMAVVMLSFLNFGVWVHGRHIALLFPFFIGIAITLRNEGQRTALLILFASLLALFVTYAAMGVHAFLA